MNYQDLGFAVLRRRRQMGLNQRKTAERAGISRNYLSMIERGAANNLSVEVLSNVARALEVEPADWLRILTGGES